VWFAVEDGDQLAPADRSSSGSIRTRRADVGASELVPAAAPLCDWTDLDLVAALLDQSGDAYAEIYRRHVASVTAAARMILMKDHRCEDVIAEVFVSLWFFPEKFDPARGTLLAYLRLKARGRSIDIVRSEAARTRRETAEPPTFSDFNAEGALIGAEGALAVREALDRLPLVQREAIVLAFFSGLTYTEVAIRLGVPEGTVKSRIRMGLSRLRLDDGLLSFGDDEDADR
jgi:RNA polymerase sigma-70 factor (ECF subfamily)